MLNINRFSTLLGFEKTLPPMRAAKAVQALEKRYRYTFHDDDKKEIGKEVLAESEFIAYELQNGGRLDSQIERPCGKCNEPYCVEENDCTKGKTKHYIWSGGLGTSITKTGYGFAQWLIAEGLTTFDAIEARIEAETAEKERLAQEAAQTALEQRKAAETEETAENEYATWKQEAIKNYGGIGTPEGAKILILRDVFLNVIGEYHERAVSLLVLIDNIDNPRCRRDLISRLHNGNVASIKTFEHITGIKLAKTSKARIAQLEIITKADFAEPKQYKPRKATVEADYNSVFYKKKRCDNGKSFEFVEARGRLWTYGGFDFYIVVSGQEKKSYSITEGKTGSMAAQGKTLQAAQDEAKKLVNFGGALSQISFADMVRQAIERDGISPLYQTDH
jgi:hypothetical protein